MPSPLAVKRMIDAGNAELGSRFFGRARTYYVDAESGSDESNGLSVNHPFATIGAFLAVAADGDTCFVWTGGTTLVDGGLTLSKDGVRIIGLDPSPHGNRWGGASASTILTITGSNCRIENIRFRVPVYSTTGGVALELTGANGLELVNCRFNGSTGSYYAINSNGSSDNVKIIGCEFFYLNTATHGHAIRGHTYTADVIHSGWLIDGCIFHSNTNHVVSRMRQSVIRNSQFVAIGLGPTGTPITTTKKLDLSGGANALWNIVTGNLLAGDYSNTGGYTAGTNDCWTGNFADDTSEAEVGDNAITLTIPAA